MAIVVAKVQIFNAYEAWHEGRLYDISKLPKKIAVFMFWQIGVLGIQDVSSCRASPPGLQSKTHAILGREGGEREGEREREGGREGGRA